MAAIIRLGAAAVQVVAAVILVKLEVQVLLGKAIPAVAELVTLAAEGAEQMRLEPLLPQLEMEALAVVVYLIQ